MVVAASPPHTRKNCYGIEADRLEGTLVQSKLVVPSARTHGLSKIKDADMQTPALRAGLYTEISHESVRPGCWVAEKAPGETAWAVGKVHNVVSSGCGTAVKLGVYYPGDANGDAVATVGLHSTALSISARPASGSFGVHSTRHAAAAGGGAAASMVFFKPNSLRYPDTEGAECLMSSVRVQGRALLDRREQLDTRESLLDARERLLAADDIIAQTAPGGTRGGLLAEKELQVQRALDHASSERIKTAAHWQGVKSAFHEHREEVLAEDAACMRTHWAKQLRGGAAPGALPAAHAAELQRVTASLLAANATIESQASAAAGGKALLAAEKANAAQANQRLAHANTSLQAHVTKAGESAAREQRVAEQRVAKLDSTIAGLTADNEQHVRRVALLEQMTARDSGSLNHSERQLSAQAVLPAATNRMHDDDDHGGRDYTQEAAWPPRERRHMHAEAAASARDWNRSRDENLKPLARSSARSSSSSSSWALQQQQPQQQGTTGSSGGCSVAHDHFVESVMKHMEFDCAP